VASFCEYGVGYCSCLFNDLHSLLRLAYCVRKPIPFKPYDEWQRETKESQPRRSVNWITVQSHFVLRIFNIVQARKGGGCLIRQ
jgi:hypothetical protein